MDERIANNFISGISVRYHDGQDVSIVQGDVRMYICQAERSGDKIKVHRYDGGGPIYMSQADFIQACRAARI